MSKDKIWICLIISILLCGCSRKEMTEDWGLKKANNAYYAGHIICRNCGWYNYLYVKKDIPKNRLDFSEQICLQCGVKGDFK